MKLEPESIKASQLSLQLNLKWLKPIEHIILHLNALLWHYTTSWTVPCCLWHNFTHKEVIFQVLWEFQCQIILNWSWVTRSWLALINASPVSIKASPVSIKAERTPGSHKRHYHSNATVETRYFPHKHAVMGQYRASTGPVLAHNGMFMGLVLQWNHVMV